MKWSIIPEFPDYSVSNRGYIRNENTDRIMRLTQNQHGVCQVGMVKGGIQYKRAVALLVAQAFLPPHKLDTFNAPINLDGERLNNDVRNLMWRPRWFAVKYHRQFDEGIRINQKLIELKTEAIFDHSLHAASLFGLLQRDIFVAIRERTYVWPTYQQFRML